MSSFSSLLNRSYKYVVGIIGLQSDDIILTSFPKSGNTWIRFFLCNLISLQEWGGETVTFPKLDATMPELGVSNLLRQWPHATIPRIVKTHKSHWPVFQGCRSILLVRDPRDVMVSYYNFETGKREERFDGSFSEFIRHPKFGIEAWCRHYISWRSNASVLLTYENLKANDVREFRRMLGAIDVEVEQNLIERAAERSQFENIKEVENNTGVRSDGDHFKEGNQFMRKGESRQWAEYFSEKDIRYVSNLLSEHDIDKYDISESGE
nr:sulfotransferase domain-containing protein [Salinibacter ruber]